MAGLEKFGRLLLDWSAVVAIYPEYLEGSQVDKVTIVFAHGQIILKHGPQGSATSEINAVMKRYYELWDQL